MSKAIVIIGNLADGFEFVGTFESFDAASRWDNENNGGFGWIATLNEPDEAVIGNWLIDD